MITFLWYMRYLPFKTCYSNEWTLHFGVNVLPLISWIASYVMIVLTLFTSSTIGYMKDITKSQLATYIATVSAYAFVLAF